MKKTSYLLASAMLLVQQAELLAQVLPGEEPGSEQRNSGDSAEMVEIVTVGEYVPDEKRATAAIANVLDAEAFKRSGDSSVAEGLKRVAGLNLAGGRYIYIRGLGERYSSTLFNGAALPSPEPIRRVVPLDMFPASVIESVLVQKTYSPRFPAEFAGGTVQMRSRVVPEEPFFQVSSTIGYSGNTSLQDGLTYSGGDTDWLGRDDGSRELPDELAIAIEGERELKRNNIIYRNGFDADELERIGESLPANYTPELREISPDTGLEASFGTAKYLGDLRLGALGSLSYNNSWDSLEVARNSYTVNRVDGVNELAPFDEQVFNSTEQSVDTSMFLTLGLEYGDAHTLQGTALNIRKTDDLAAILTGTMATEDVDIRQTRLEWIERDLLSRQLQGEHVFYPGPELTLNWHYNEARARRAAPDMREYRYDWNPGAERYQFSLRADANQRTWSSLEDNSEDLGLSASMTLGTPMDTITTLTAGMSRVRKQRSSAIRRFSFIGQGPRSNDPELLGGATLEQVINDQSIAPDGFELRESTRPTDNYEAEQAMDAAYLEADMELSYSFRLLAGLRWEESAQNVTTFDLFDREAAPIVSDLRSKDVFPVLTGTYVHDRSNMQVRLGYSETISRPDFRELSPSPFTHPVTGYEIVGNPELSVSYINNYDLRWEWYFSPDESVSIGLFYKDFETPIESAIEPGSENRRTFINAKAANTYGIEFDGLRWLDFVSEDLASWYVSANLTLIESEVSVRPEDAGILTNVTRPLQGQADYIFNLQLGFDDSFRNRGSLVYHVTGEKIREVGMLGAPDVLDEAYGELDFNYTRRWTDQLSLSLKASNLLNQSRDSSQGGLLVNGYEEGREVSLSATYSF